MEEVFVRYLHFLGIIVLSSMLVAEHILVTREIEVTQLRRVVLIDAVFGISALVVLIAGLLLWLVVGKPAEFYTANWIFHAKLAVFVLMALLSVFPTLFFIRHRKHPDNIIQIPKSIINIIRAELSLLIILPLLAALMAHGYGLG